MGEIILLIVLCVLLIVMFAMSYARRKKYNEGLSTMREELKKGDRVMTDSGIVGEIVDSYVEEEYKYFVIKSGKGNNVSFFSVHANAIYYAFGKDEATKITTTKHNVKSNTETKPEEQVNEDKKVESLVTDQLTEENKKLNETKPQNKNKSNKKSKK